MNGHPIYLQLLDEMKELHQRKAADYGRGQDPFANVRAGAEFGTPAWVGVMIRANDKMHRIKSLIANGSLKNESVEDSLMDLAAYCLIALTLRREAETVKPDHVVDAPPDEVNVELVSPARAKPEYRKRVYIAGPISSGDLLDNINLATEAHRQLMKAGFAPHCPHWSVYSKRAIWGRLIEGKVVRDAVMCQATADGNGASHAEWLAIDLPWVAAADALLRLSGESRGADIEVAEAHRMGIPVCYSVDEVKRLFAPVS